MRERIVTTHVHDNHGEKDEHLLPFEGSIDWDATLKILASAPNELPHRAGTERAGGEFTNPSADRRGVR